MEAAVQRTVDKYDTWERRNLALNALQRLVFLMCEIKPDAKSPLFPAWDAEMCEVRKLCVENHERGIDLNLRDLKKWREDNDSSRTRAMVQR